MTDRPRISIALPQDVGDGGPAPLIAFARRAEAAGFHGLWTLDSAVGGPTGHVPNIDALHALSFAAAVTARVRLGVAVIVAPRRNPAQLAKDLASIDRLSTGRLTVGLGIGNDGEEMAALGFPTTRRGRRLEECVGVLRALWTESEAAYDGEFLTFAGVRMEPKPVQRPHPPLWIGAGKPPALRRAARIADGWIGAGSSSVDDFERQAPAVREAVAEAGRDPAAFPMAKRVYVAVEDSRERALARLTPVLDGMYDWPGITDRVAVAGPPEEVAEQLARLTAAGAGELLLNPLYEPDEQLERLAAIAGLEGA